ncbi:MAG: aspartate-semialdehyde dehydrogenase [Christensenellaceae bacterium]|jgi:aspartate-semialdehyde dehydrogenase|nr:aspartate-semialdehyde dehydrogenase [Christensenellaceae bacterium]
MSKAKCQPKIAVVGSSGLVGSKMVKVLRERSIAAKYFYFNSKNVLTEKKIVEIKPDFVLMAVSAELSAKWTPVFTENGATVIDNSSYYRMHENVPLVVPEINPQDIFEYRSPIIANPNCSTIGSVVAFAPLCKKYKIKRVVYSTYQAISGAGANPKFGHPIANNLIPQIDEFCENGNTKEEEKMINETKKILHNNDISVTATCVRVPIANCHSVSINVEFFDKPDINEVKKILSKAKGVILFDGNKYPMPILADGKDNVFVGRLRMDNDNPNAINMFTVSDNLRKGAATNAVQILELLLKGKKNVK